MDKYILELTEEELKMVRLGLLNRSTLLIDEGLEEISEEYMELEHKIYNIQYKRV